MIEGKSSAGLVAKLLFWHDALRQPVVSADPQPGNYGYTCVGVTADPLIKDQLKQQAGARHHAKTEARQLACNQYLPGSLAISKIVEQWHPYQSVARSP